MDPNICDSEVRICWMWYVNQLLATQGDNLGHVSYWAHSQGFTSTTTQKWSFQGVGNTLLNGPEKDLIIYTLGQQLVWLFTSLNPGQHRVLSYLKMFANLLSRLKKASTCSSQLHFLKIPSEIEKCHVYWSLIIFILEIVLFTVLSHSFSLSQGKS